jgi:WD40 repeat protein
LRFNQLEEVIFSADDRSIIAVSKNHRFTRWSLSENQIIKQTPIEAHIFTPPVFINGNQDFAVGDETGQLQIWNIQTHQLLQEFQHDKRILWLISDPDNNRIIFGDGYQEYSLDLSTYEILPLSAYQLSEAILNPDKTKIAGYKSGIVLLINSENMTDHCQIPSNKNQLMLFSPTGNQLVLSNGYTATIWNVSECNQIASLNLGVDIQNKSMSFSENGDHFMITKLDHWPYGHPLIQTWETAHWTLVEEKVFDQEAFGVGQFCFCGNYVLLSEGLYKIGEWDSPVDKYNPAYLPLTDCNQELIFSETGWGFFALIGVR